MKNSKITIRSVREQIILKLYYACIIFSFFLGILRFFQGEILYVIINFSLVAITLVSLYLFKNKSQVLLDIMVVSLLGVTLILSQDDSIVSIIIYLSMFPALTTLLYDSKWKRYTVCIVSIGIYTYIFRDNLSEAYTYYILAVSGLYIALKFTEVLELQQDDLYLALEDKEKLSNELALKNKDLITFSHIMTHDLKAPLRNIQMFSKLIKSKNKLLDKKHREYFEFIEQSSDSMFTLIKDLLVYHKVDSEQAMHDKVDLNEIINTIKTTYQFELTNNNLKLESEQLPIVKGDKNLLRTLFHNLITNSIKYQPKNKSNHLPQINISTQSTESNVHISISDNGIGIHKDYLEKLFDPFTRFHNNAEYSGSGLGMSICKRVMLKHGGDIELVETSPNGTTFKLLFPKQI